MCTCARRISIASASSTSTCSASTSWPRRATFRAGVRPATSCSSRPAATTTTSGSTPGSRAAAHPSPTAGLHHVALNYPTRAGLADALARLRAVDWPIRQATDHGTHLAIYVSDPDGNDLELAWDRPIAEWPRDPQGRLAVAMDDPLDLDALLAEAPA
jgi:glyoxalase/bleomycin resistance protein/dioxygenase superfamily protein